VEGGGEAYRSLYSFICSLGDEQSGRVSPSPWQITENKRNLVWVEVAGFSMRDEFLVTLLA